MDDYTRSNSEAYLKLNEQYVRAQSLGTRYHNQGVIAVYDRRKSIVGPMVIWLLITVVVAFVAYTAGIVSV